MPDERYQEFTGTLPYASELFGVYQPLPGWRGKQAQQRVYKEQLGLAEQVMRGMLNDSRVHRLIQDKVMLVSPDTPLPPRIPAWLQSVAANHVQLAVAEFIRTNHRVPTAHQEWANVLHAASVRVHAALNGLSAEERQEGANAPKVASVRVNAALHGPSAEEPTLATIAVLPKSDLQTSSAPLHESLVFGMLDYLHRHAPEALRAMFLESQRPWEITKNFLNALNDFHVDVRNTVLSPIGILTLYREYFFELKSFLGPPVEHLWLSPGGSIELFEVHTRRTIVDKQIETATEITTRTEVTTTMQEELADAIKQEHQQNEKFGTSASGGVNFPVWHAQASLNYEQEDSQRTAEESTHKVLRQESEKLSNEIRRSFKTTFKTTLETEDTFSRRYTIQNTTEKLVNYELRRKMRQVGVQVQHIGTQLCWQVYLDDPGKDLAIAELVHVAKPQDLSPDMQPPEAPQRPPAKETTWKVNFPYQATKGYDTEAEYTNGSANDGDDQIVWFRDYVAPTPGIGYTLHAVNVTPGPRVSPNDDPAIVAAHAVPQPPDPDRFRLYLDQVNFRDQPSIDFKLSLIWESPPVSDEQQRAYEQKLADFNERERRETHAQYVQLVRERIKLVRSIRPRDEKDLREEERAVVSGRVIQKLMQLAPDQTRPMVHVTAELIQQIFEVDKLLYFVVPYWWMPRNHGQPGPSPRSPGNPAVNPAIAGNPAAAGRSGSSVALRAMLTDNGGDGTDRSPNGGNEGSGDDSGSSSGGRIGPGRVGIGPLPVPELLTGDDLVGWDGLAPKDRDHYLITEDSAPAPMGASLGWLLQPDGDNHRNAFLNSPWVKAVLPIRPGMEMAALDWLMQLHVEGTDGLDEPLEAGGLTLRDQIHYLAQRIAALNSDLPASLATETVFETGFNPLAGGFRAPGTPQLPDGSPARPGMPYVLFDQWIEILPTNQVVAVEYKPEEHGG